MATHLFPRETVHYAGLQPDCFTVVYRESPAVLERPWSMEIAKLPLLATGRYIKELFTT
jgi:hypothetical protein